MTIRLSFAKEIEGRLRARAEALGLSPDEFARRAVERAMAEPLNGGTESSDRIPADEAHERVRRLKEWMAARRSTANSADGNRDSIYEGRGE